MKRLSYQNDSLDDIGPNDGRGYEQAPERDVNGDLRLVSDDEGNLIASLTDRPKFHMPVIDIDLPIRAVPSTTEGHFHLYIEHAVSESSYFKLLDALADCGIVEDGFVAAAKARGMTMVRKPGVTKPVVAAEAF